jgi:chromosome partitioning protein
VLTYTVYSEAGGVGKSTLAATLAAAHSRSGDEVLLIDLDPQDGSVSYLLDVVEDRQDPEADNLARHMVGDARGSFQDLVRTTDQSIDIIPNHAELETLTEWLIRAEQRNDWSEGERYEQLLRVLQEADVNEDYDVIIVDPPATTGPHLYNAIHATRSLVLPIELSGKGKQSIEGLAGLVESMEDTLDISIGVLAIVPNGNKMTNDQEAYLEEIEDLGYDAPVVIRDRASLMEASWDEQCTPFTYAQVHRTAKRPYELETLEKFEELAAYFKEQ